MKLKVNTKALINFNSSSCSDSIYKSYCRNDLRLGSSLSRWNQTWYPTKRWKPTNLYHQIMVIHWVRSQKRLESMFICWQTRTTSATWDSDLPRGTVLKTTVNDQKRSNFSWNPNSSGRCDWCNRCKCWLDNKPRQLMTKQSLTTICQKPVNRRYQSCSSCSSSGNSSSCSWEVPVAETPAQPAVPETPLRCPSYQCCNSKPRNSPSRFWSSSNSTRSSAETPVLQTKLRQHNLQQQKLSQHQKCNQ